MTTQLKRLNKADLLPFTDSEQRYRYPFAKSITYTDGVKYVAQHGRAYWIIDDIIFAQLVNPGVADEPFQVWKIQVNPDHTGVLTCGDGNDDVWHTQELECTSFPLDELTLYFANNVILLPSEY